MKKIVHLLAAIAIPVLPFQQIDRTPAAQLPAEVKAYPMTFDLRGHGEAGFCAEDAGAADLDAREQAKLACLRLGYRSVRDYEVETATESHDRLWLFVFHGRVLMNERTCTRSMLSVTCTDRF